jgi:hypothetical protein
MKTSTLSLSVADRGPEAKKNTHAQISCAQCMFTAPVPSYLCAFCRREGRQYDAV